MNSARAFACLPASPLISDRYWFGPPTALTRDFEDRSSYYWPPSGAVRLLPLAQERSRWLRRLVADQMALIWRQIASV